MKARNISTKTIRYLKKFNNIRKIRADVFALSHLNTISYLLNTHHTENQITDEMNKLGLRTATGLRWSTKRLKRLRMRLEALLRGTHSKRPPTQAMIYTSNELEQLRFMSSTRLNALYLYKSDYSDMREHMCLWVLDY